METQAASANPVKKTPLLALILSWTFVGIPLIWGVVQVVVKTMAIFQ